MNILNLTFHKSVISKMCTIIAILIICSQVVFAQCSAVCPDQNYTATNGGIVNAGFMAWYILVDDASGNVIDVNSTGSFDVSALAEGQSYNVHYFNFNTTTPPSPLTGPVSLADMTNLVGVNVNIIGSITPGCYNNSDFLTDFLCLTVSTLSSTPAITLVGPFCVNENPAPSALEAIPNIGGNTINWYVGNDFATATSLGTSAPIPDVTIAGSTTYWATEVNTDGCEGPENNITVVVNSLPLVSIATLPKLCTTTGSYVCLLYTSPSPRD